MGNQGNFRRTGNYNRAGERINNNRKPFRPNDGQRQQNKTSPKKDADSKAKPVKESEDKNKDDKQEKSEEDKREAPKTRYDDLNPQLLKCHICNKSMWDGRSFENHLSGRAHAIMMQKTAESYALTADTMRQEFKIREMKRTRKTGQQPPRDFYCAMCDMYAADGAIHRTTVGHRKLKKYLHPTCTSCHKEMPTRIELDEHRLTAEHLKNMQDKQEVVSKPKPEVMVISTLNMEQMYLRDDRQRWRRSERMDKDNKDDKQNEDGDEESKKDQDVEIKQEAGEKKTTDNENTIVDYKEGDDISKITSEMIPMYSTDRGVGKSFLSPFSCIQCTLCRKLLDSEETAEVHLRTWRHHQLFLRVLSTKSGQGQQATETQKRSHTEESGNWKRRKTSPDDEEGDQNGHEETVKAEAEEEVNLDEEDTDLHAADELEDWEQSVDEILNDEANKDDENKEEPEKEPETDQKAELEPVEEEEPEEKKVKIEQEDDNESKPEEKKETKPEEKDKPVTQQSLPRGRGRGRHRY